MTSKVKLVNDLAVASGMSSVTCVQALRGCDWDLERAKALFARPKKPRVIYRRPIAGDGYDWKPAR